MKVVKPLDHTLYLVNGVLRLVVYGDLNSLIIGFLFDSLTPITAKRRQIQKPLKHSKSIHQSRKGQTTVFRVK